MDFQASLQPITQVSDGSVILTQEGGRICNEGDWNATNDEEIKIAQNRIMFLCSSTNINYNHMVFWTQRIDSSTVIAKRKESNDRLIIKKTHEIKGIDKYLFICVHYTEGKNDFDSVLSAVKIVYNNIQFPPCCAKCNQLVSKEDKAYYKQRLYHKKCIKCFVCDKELNQEDDIVEIDGMFICKQHYDEYTTNPDKMSPEVVEKYVNYVKENFVENVLGKSLLEKEDISSYPSDEVFISNETVYNSSNKSELVQDFLPTIEIHFEKQIEEIDFDQLTSKILGPNVKILDIKRGSTMLTIALLEMGVLGHNAKKICDEYVKDLKGRVDSPLGRKIVGNILSEPEVKIPDKQSSWFKKPSINRLQKPIPINDENLEDYKKQIFKKIKNKDDKENIKFVFKYQKLYGEMEEQLRKDLEDNPFEMIIVNYSIIADNFYKKYEEIESKIPENEKYQCFYYHGSRLENHMKIVKNHFLMPGEDKIDFPTDKGYYGQGIYATDNPYYASMYSNGPKELDINGKAYVICCRSIYNKTKIIDVNNTKDFIGKSIKPEIKEAFGINHALVGSSTKPFPFSPIDKSMIEENKFCANEFVFPYKYQFIPFCSVEIMKKAHYILWNDDEIDNKENTENFKKLSKKLEVNIYQKTNVDDALELIKKKKYAYFKLITNAGKNSSGKELIEKARELIGSNFVCLVFDNEPSPMEWISKMENVLFTTNKKYLKKFVKVKMNFESIKDFISKLEKSTKFKFNINDEQLLNFPRISEVSLEDVEKSSCNIA